jgi:hypothetical protein
MSQRDFGAAVSVGAEPLPAKLNDQSQEARDLAEQPPLLIEMIQSISRIHGRASYSKA